MYAVEQWKIIEKESSRKSATITAAICSLLLLILFLWVLGWPKEDETPLSGMLIDFGTTEIGQGNTSEPAPAPKSNPVVNHQEQEVVEQSQPEPNVSEPEVTPTVPDEVVTQDVQEAPVVTPDKEDPQPTQEEIEAAQAALEAQQQAEAEAAAQAALEAQQQAEAEAAAQAAAEQAAQQAEADALAEQLNNAWGEGNGTGDGEGDDGIPGGDAGDPNGVPNGGDGLGEGGDGPALWGLDGRGWAKSPKVNDNSQRFGKVTLKIKVDRNGNIISAEFTNYKSTTTDAVLIQRAKDALKNAKITSNVNAASEEFGYVTFNFTAK